MHDASHVLADLATDGRARQNAAPSTSNDAHSPRRAEARSACSRLHHAPTTPYSCGTDLSRLARDQRTDAVMRRKQDRRRIQNRSELHRCASPGQTGGTRASTARTRVEFGLSQWHARHRRWGSPAGVSQRHAIEPNRRSRHNPLGAGMESMHHMRTHVHATAIVLSAPDTARIHRTSRLIPKSRGLLADGSFLDTSACGSRL